MPRAISSIRLGISTPALSGPANATPAFSPDDVAGLTSWWDASDAATLTTTGTEVDSWANKVSGAPALVPYTSSPSIPNTATIDSKDWIDFDVADSEALRVADPADSALLFGSGEMSIFVAYRSTRNVAQVLLNKGSNVGGRYRLRLNHTVADDMQGVIHDGTTSYPRTSGAINTTDGNTHVMSLFRDNTANLLRVRLDNGSEVTTSISGAGSTDETSGAAFVAQLIVGAQPSGPGLDAFFDGQIGEILFYNTYIDGDDRNSIETYLSGKWT